MRHQKGSLCLLIPWKWSSNFNQGHVLEGKRYFKLASVMSRKAETGVYEKVWELKGRQHGNPTYGEDYFHGRNSYNPAPAELAQAIENYLRTLNLGSDFGVREGGNPLSLDFWNCPLGLEVMRDPVLCACGHSFERRHITTWLERDEHCPITRAVHRAADLIPNRQLKESIEAARATGNVPNDHLTLEQKFNVVVNVNMRMLTELRESQRDEHEMRRQVRSLITRCISVEGTNEQLQQALNQSVAAGRRSQGIIADLTGTVQDQRRQIGDLESQNATLQQRYDAAQRNLQETTHRLNERERQIQNLQNMGVLDGLCVAGAAVFGRQAAVIDGVMNRPSSV